MIGIDATSHLPLLLAQAPPPLSIWGLLQDLVTLLGVALVLGVLAERLKQSAIVGYMLAGVLAGPNVLGWIDNFAAVRAIADLGVSLLMFTIGLEFSWSRLRRLGVRALAQGGGQIIVTGAVAFGVITLFGVGFPSAVTIGAAVALSSTAVVLPILAGRGEVDSVHGRFALGVLLVQDAAVVPLVLIVAAVTTGGSPITVAQQSGISALIVIGLFLGCFLFAKFAMPPLLRFATAKNNREVPVLIAAVTAIGMAYVANSFGLSAALGAFIAAIFLGESILATQIRADALPLRTLFVTLFFGSIGMLADPVWIGRNLHLVLGGLAAVVVGKAVLAYGVGVASRLSHRHAAAAGLCLAQIGVFSFVLIQTGEAALRDENPDLLRLMVSVIILSIFLTPYLVAAALTAGGWWEQRLRKLGLVRAARAGEAEAIRGETGHVVIIGFGPAGKGVAEPLRRAVDPTAKPRDHVTDDDTTETTDRKPPRVPIVVVDLNPRTIQAARAQGIRGVVGDATQPSVADQLNLSAARALIVTVPDFAAAVAVIRESRAACPNILIIARARYAVWADELKRAGAEVVIDEEATVGVALGRRLAAALDLELDADEQADDP